MVPKKGTNGLPENCADMISRALRDELGSSARAVKTIMQWTGSSDRAAKYWLAGARCPNGRQLIMLARHSDAVLYALLKMANRDLFMVSIELNTLQAALTRASEMISALKAR